MHRFTTVKVAMDDCRNGTRVQISYKAVLAMIRFLDAVLYALTVEAIRVYNIEKSELQKANENHEKGKGPRFSERKRLTERHVHTAAAKLLANPRELLVCDEKLR